MLDLNRLNCMNYHVADTSGEHWYAQNGLRSLYQYAIRSDKSFREICTELNNLGEVTFKYHLQAHKMGIDSPELNLAELTLTMI
jgi:hypothetical protein